MISKSCNFTEFLDKVTNLEHDDIILVANEEATAAERFFYRQRDRQNENNMMYQEYAILLKGFIGNLRNIVKLPSKKHHAFKEQYHKKRNKVSID